MSVSGDKLGIFVNGVELSNYKSKDSIKYGELSSIEVLDGGNGYDVINPQNLISDKELLLQDMLMFLVCG